MKTYPKLCHRLLILSNWWASEKSTSRYRNRWKAIQNCVIDYSFWVIVEHPKNRRLVVAIDENLSKIVSSITHFEYLLSIRKIDISVSQWMKTYLKYRRLNRAMHQKSQKIIPKWVILKHPIKSTSRYRNWWKAIQNCVIDYSFWVIAEHPKNRRLGVAMDENLFKIWAIESFDAPEIVGASFWGSENVGRMKKKANSKQNACFIF